MGTKGPVRILDTADFALNLLSERELLPRARLIANFIAEVVPDSAVVVYVLENRDTDPIWRPRATVGDVHVDAEHAQHLSVFQEFLEHPRPVIFPGSELAREAYAHLD